MAEMRDPVPDAEVRRAEDLQTWGINFQRRIRRQNEDSYWAPIPRIYQLVARVAGRYASRRSPGCDPARTCASSRMRSAAGATSARRGTLGDADAGIDVKYGVTSGLTWDFTVNTDFSQVEADEQQINLTRFSLLLPREARLLPRERRRLSVRTGDDRLTGGGGALAAAAVRTPSQDIDPVLQPPRSACPKMATRFRFWPGTRLTGQAGPFTIGALNIQQQSEGLTPVARTSRRSGCAANVLAQLRHRRHVPEQGAGRPTSTVSSARTPTSAFFQQPRAQRLHREDVLARGRSSARREAMTTARATASAGGINFWDVRALLPSASASDSATKWGSCRARASPRPRSIVGVAPPAEAHVRAGCARSFPHCANRQHHALESAAASTRAISTITSRSRSRTARSSSSALNPNVEDDRAAVPDQRAARHPHCNPAGTSSTSGSSSCNTNAAAPIVVHEPLLASATSTTDISSGYQLGATARVNEHLQPLG